MDFIKLRNRTTEIFQKYKYICLILIVGMILMSIPNKTDDEQSTVLPKNETREQTGIEEQLAEILGEIQGAGKVKVMLSIGEGERTIYQTDDTFSQGEQDTDSRTQTVLITDASRNETGLIHQINPPVYQGAIILAQGADRPNVKLSIVDAVSKITGLGADRISVLKMQ